MNAQNKRRPGRKCSICEHPQRSEIELARNSGKSIRWIAERFHTTLSSIQNHVTAHMKIDSEIVALVRDFSIHNPGVSVLSLDDQMDMIMALCQRLVQDLSEQVDSITNQGEYLITTAKGDVIINPVIAELRQMVAVWNTVVGGLKRTQVSAAWVKLEGRKQDLMERCLMAALASVGIVSDRQMSVAMLAMAEELRRAG